MDYFKKMIMYFTLQERERRAYKRYELNRQRFESLTILQLHERYIKMKSLYEYKKSFLTFFVVTLFLTILTGIWKGFFQYFKQALQLFFNQENSLEVTKVIIVISVFLLVTIVVVMFISIVLYLKNLYRLYEQLMLIEDVRENKNKEE